MEKKVTRRQAGVFLAGLGLVPARAQANNPGTTIHQEVDFKAPPARIYEVLLDAKQFSSFTGDTAEIEPRAGGTFKLFGGRIEGRNIELVPGQRLVQAWRPGDWPAGVYSIAKFELVAHDAGTHLVFDHSGFTADHWESLNAGWIGRYWKPLHKYLNA